MEENILFEIINTMYIVWSLFRTKPFLCYSYHVFKARTSTQQNKKSKAKLKVLFFFL